MGFQGDIRKKSEKKDVSVYRDVTPHDIVKYGLIPELVGRLPILVTLDDLDEASLVRILKEPKNALVKQYEKLLGYDNVALSFTDEALEKIAHQAIIRSTGARGLRSIMEEVMLDIMYQTPSDPTIQKIVITADTVEKKMPPEIVRA